MYLGIYALFGATNVRFAKEYHQKPLAGYCLPWLRPRTGRRSQLGKAVSIVLC